MRRLLSFGLLVMILIGLISLGVRYANRLQKRTTPITELLTLAKNFEERTNLKEAKAVYQKLINDYSNSNLVSDWQKKLEDLNIQLLFSTVVTDKSVIYEVQRTDTLIKIANKFNTTVDLIRRSNNLKSDKILVGKKLKVHNRPFSILVDKSRNKLILKSDEEVIKTYVVSTGADNSTPIGTFKIVNKLIDPTWYKEGVAIPPGRAENILGSRWLGFDLRGYGIHGTTDPASLGQHVTQGCVRMANRDVEELYIIVPAGTEVVITQ